MSSLFVSGSLFTWAFSTPVGRLTFTATILIRGTELALWDAEFFPVAGGRLALGVSGIRRLIDELCDLGHTEGLDLMRLSGYRMGGAMPGRESDMRIVCRPIRSRDIT